MHIIAYIKIYMQCTYVLTYVNTYTNSHLYEQAHQHSHSLKLMHIVHFLISLSLIETHAYRTLFNITLTH